MDKKNTICMNSQGEILLKQLNNFFSFSFDLSPYIKKAVERSLTCFGMIKNKYYQNAKEINITHSGQYTIFLYYLANEMFRNGVDSDICSQVYYLNKILNSVDLFYEVELPEHFFCDHPLGSVMGRAKYGDYFTFMQGCTVGNNKGIYPVIGDFITMNSNSSIIGNCHIRSYVVIGANACIKDEDIPDNCLVFGQSPNLVIKKRSNEQMLSYFDRLWKR